jgi:hypothetical protein
LCKSSSGPSDKSSTFTETSSPPASHISEALLKVASRREKRGKAEIPGRKAWSLWRGLEMGSTQVRSGQVRPGQVRSARSTILRMKKSSRCWKYKSLSTKFCARGGLEEQDKRVDAMNLLTFVRSFGLVRALEPCWMREVSPDASCANA